MENGVPPLDRERVRQGEEYLENESKKIDAFADQAARNGAYPKTVTHIRSKAQARELAELKARATLAGDSFEMDAIAYLSKNRITGTIDTKIALNKFKIQYLQEKGLYGLPSDFMADMFDNIRQASKSIIYEAQVLEVSEENKGFLNQAVNGFLGAPSIEAKKAKLNDLFYLKAAVFEDGKKANGGTAAVVWIIDDFLGDPAKVTDEELPELLEVKTDNGQSWGERYKNRIYDMRRERINEKAADANRQLALNKVKSIEKVNEVITWIKDGNWNKDEVELNKIIFELKKKGVGKDELDLLNPYLAQSFQSQREDFWTEEFTKKLNNNTLSEVDFIPGLVPLDVWKNFSQKAKELDKQRGIIGWSTEELKSSFKPFIRRALSLPAVEGSDELYVAEVLEYAIQRYNYLRLANYKQRVNADPRSSAADAKLQVQDEITRQLDKFKVQQGSELTDEEGKKTLKRNDLLYNQWLYPAFVSGSHVGSAKYNKFDPEVESTTLTLEHKKNPKYLLENQFIETEILIKEADSISKNLGLLIPRIVYDLAKKDPSLGSPLDIMKNQFKLAGIEVNIGEDYRKQWTSQVTGDDPKAIKLIQSIRGIEDAAIAHEVVFKNGSSNPNFMDPRVKRAVVPEAVKASVNPESTHPALASLINFSEGRLSDNFIFNNIDNKPTLEITDLETMHYLIDNMDETGWVYNLDTGLLEYTGGDK